MYVDDSAHGIVKWGKIKWFRIASGMYHIPFTVQCIYGWNDEGGE